MFTNDGNIKPENLLSLTNVYINHFEICNSHTYSGYFLRDPSIAHNINGIRIRNSKKYIYKLSTGFAMPQFVLSPLCLALPHLLANNLIFVFIYQLTYVKTKKKQQN